MSAAGNPDAPHLPRLAPIDAYGNGGFRFAAMSHRGSILCLPTGIWAWDVAAPTGIDEEALAPVFSQAADIGLFLLGTGRQGAPVSDQVRAKCRELGVSLEVMPTGTAVGMFNILLAENRRVAAGLIAVA